MISKPCVPPCTKSSVHPTCCLHPLPSHFNTCCSSTQPAAPTSPPTPLVSRLFHTEDQGGTLPWCLAMATPGVPLTVQVHNVPDGFFYAGLLSWDQVTSSIVAGSTVIIKPTDTSRAVEIGGTFDLDVLSPGTALELQHLSMVTRHNYFAQGSGTSLTFTSCLLSVPAGTSPTGPLVSISSGASLTAVDTTFANALNTGGEEALRCTAARPPTRPTARDHLHMPCICLQNTGSGKLMTTCCHYSLPIHPRWWRNPAEIWLHCQSHQLHLP
jgi:hypothetical protein